MSSLLNTIKHSFTIELLKYKRTYALSLAILAPAFLAIIVFFVYFFKAEALIKNGMNGWANMIDYSLQFSTSLLFPLFIILLVVFIHNLEHRTNGQRLFKTLPIPSPIAYFSKYFIALSLLVLSMLVFGLFINLGAFVNSIKYPALFQYDPELLPHLLTKISYLFICSFFMFAIQYWVSQHFSNIIIPIGIGFAGFISAMILIQGWEHIDYHPYALHLLTMANPEEEATLRQLFTYSLAGGTGISILGYLDIKFKRLFI